MLNRVIHTEQKLALFGLSSGLCKMCNVHQESLVHLLWDRPFAKQIWCKIIPRIELYLLNELDIELVNPIQTVLLGRYTFPSKTKLVNTLIIETKWMIWKNRNDMKYNNNISKCNVLLNCIMKNVNNQLHWKKDHCVMYIYTYMLVYFCGLKSLHNKYNYNVYTNLHTHARTHAHATHTHTHTNASSHIQTHKTHARTHTYAHTHTNAQNKHTFIFIKYVLCHYTVYVCIAFLVMDESVIFAFLL